MTTTTCLARGIPRRALSASASRERTARPLRVPCLRSQASRGRPPRVSRRASLESPDGALQLASKVLERAHGAHAVGDDAHAYERIVPGDSSRIPVVSVAILV